jgi:hypothetical protein
MCLFAHTGYLVLREGNPSSVSDVLTGETTMIRATVDIIPAHAASRIVTIHEQLNLSPHVWSPVDRERLSAEQSQLWDRYFPGKAYEEIAALVPAFMLKAA